MGHLRGVQGSEFLSLGKTVLREVFQQIKTALVFLLCFQGQATSPSCHTATDESSCHIQRRGSNNIFLFEGKFACKEMLKLYMYML